MSSSILQEAQLQTVSLGLLLQKCMMPKAFAVAASANIS